jgi:peptide chain release factor 1
MSLASKLGPIKARHEELAALMSAGNLSGDKFVKLSREYAELSPVVETIDAYNKMLKEQEDLQAMVDDPDMGDIATQELIEIKHKLPELERQVQLALIPRDEADSKNVILEIRAGTGGDEAALFAADLFGMYRGYCSQKGWSLQVVEMSESDLGGYREIIAEITGVNVFARMKFESGVHRVQRVPKTEAQGRIHTSAATVAVLPEAEEVDVHIEEKDLRVDVFRAQGAGGQHVNKTESAVRITHIPTGTVVSMQDEKSQIKNRARAMQILRSRIYEQERQRLADIRATDRKSQVGSGDRSERIRTYNYPQSRVTDHRINLTLYNLDAVVTGEDLDKIIEPLIAEDQAEKLAALDF